MRARRRSPPLLLVVPLVAMVAATDWAGLAAELALGAAARGAAARRCVTSTAAMLVCLVLGPAAGLAAGPRRLPRPRRCCGPLVTVPLVLPPVVAGIALRSAFGRTGVIGEPLLRADGLRLPLHDVGRGARPHVRLDAVRA